MGLLPKSMQWQGNHTRLLAWNRGFWNNWQVTIEWKDIPMVRLHTIWRIASNVHQPPQLSKSAKELDQRFQKYHYPYKRNWPRVQQLQPPTPVPSQYLWLVNRKFQATAQRWCIYAVPRPPPKTCKQVHSIAIDLCRSQCQQINCLVPMANLKFCWRFRHTPADCTFNWPVFFDSGCSYSRKWMWRSTDSRPCALRTSWLPLSLFWIIHQPGLWAAAEPLTQDPCPKLQPLWSLSLPVVENYSKSSDMSGQSRYQVPLPQRLKDLI